MNVKIINLSTNQEVDTYGISLQGFPVAPTDLQLFEEAWRCAVADGDVDAQRKADYTYEIVK